MSDPGAGAGAGKSLTAWETLKAVAQYLGVLGSGGAGFAGLAFGIGYLATKHHDAMLGMPTTTTDYATYVRTGALFFTQTLHDLVASLATLATPLARVIAVFIGATVVLIGLPMLTRTLAKKATAPWLRWLPLLVASAALLLASLVNLPRHLAPLDAGNKNLLFEQRVVAGAAAEVNTRLRERNSEVRLHELYGTQWVVLLGLALGALVLTRWRQAVGDGAAGDPVEPVLRTLNDWVLRPATYLVIGALVVTTPANYGVLAMSTSLPCVQLYSAKDDGKPAKLGGSGFLVSDLSSEKGEIAVLRWDAEKNSYFVDFHPRTALKQIEVAYCPVHNPVSRVLAPPA